MRKRAAGWSGGLLALFLVTFPATAADAPSLEPLALCRESWVDWQKANDPRLASFAAWLRSGFTQKEGDAFIVPNKPLSLAGFRVEKVFPDSVGMGVGFSVMIAATFEDAQKVFEKKLGKPLAHCETSDGMRSCEAQIADQRSFVLMTSDKPGDSEALIGCYYFYEK